ncbi:MAG TPA: hypothetical protein PLP25_10725, partial [Candidatus Limiplasma sp.]|nr:hypothetical protein [Candidatus Limiplasma sp.]
MKKIITALLRFPVWLGKAIGRFFGMLFRKTGAELRKPKWRHGGFGLLLVGGLLTVCVLLNVGVKNLEDT